MPGKEVLKDRSFKTPLIVHFIDIFFDHFVPSLMGEARNQAAKEKEKACHMGSKMELGLEDLLWVGPHESFQVVPDEVS